MRSEEVLFESYDGHQLSGILELPVDREPGHFAIFAHCFTCGKDLRVVRNLTLALSQNGFGVLRFDFTGLGESGGDFADSDFSSNVDDILAAADFLEEKYRAPSLLIGHSLGGTAVLIAGGKMDSIKAIATIGAPSEPDHVLHLLKEELDEIRKNGMATVQLAGREFNIKSGFVEDLENFGMQGMLDKLRGKSLLFMHSPQDEIVEIENARVLYEKARHPKSFVSLDGSDHLLTKEEDSRYAGNLIAGWARRYLPEEVQEEISADEDVLALLGEGPFLTEILAGRHHLLSDEPEDVGGSDFGPTPYELLASGLGACTTMTIKMYADRKKWPLDEVRVYLRYDGKYNEDCLNCEENESRIGQFERIIELEGDLDEKQRERILQIANKCPVHRTMERGVNIETRLRAPGGVEEEKDQKDT